MSLERLKKTIKTKETFYEYTNLSKSEKNEVKDVGGFIGGWFIGENRSGDVVRSIITLDIDEVREEDEVLNQVLSLPFKVLAYTTRNHTPYKPRYRVVIPLSEDIDGEKYREVVSNLFDALPKITMDSVSLKPGQIMYFPNCSCDREVRFFENRAEKILEIKNNKKEGKKTMSDNNEVKVQKKEERKEAVVREIDPRTKTGIIGKFCRKYSITKAIEEFLTDVYTETEKTDRYTYIEGSTDGGLVIYNDIYAYSNHASDPAYGKKLNAFDLVKIHKFGDDGDAFKKMLAFGKECLEGKKEKKKIENYSLGYKFTRDEIWGIFNNDPKLDGIRYDTLNMEFTVDDDVPVPWKRIKGFWNESDDANLKSYLEKNYHLDDSVKITDVMFGKVKVERAFNPAEEYFESLEWDGTERLETVLVDYLGADDTEYVKAVSRKTFVAAVARTYEPGVKFDNVLVLTGPQGCGKSTLFSKMAGEWFTDSLNIKDMNDKSGCEKLLGTLIAEIPELQGRRKSDAETIKAFITRRVDRFRPAYAKKATNFARSCIIVGTTNDNDFLTDTTGNRRFWPVSVSEKSEKHSWELTEKDIKQLWAEAVYRYFNGEELFLKPELAKYAEKVQSSRLEVNSDMEGLIEEYLEMPLPLDWESQTPLHRNSTFREYLRSEECTGDEFDRKREKVCIQEIVQECLDKDIENTDRKLSNEVSRILKKLGWEQTGKERVRNYGSQRVFQRKK